MGVQDTKRMVSIHYQEEFKRDPWDFTFIFIATTLGIEDFIQSARLLSIAHGFRPKAHVPLRVVFFWKKMDGCSTCTLFPPPHPFQTGWWHQKAFSRSAWASVLQFDCWQVVARDPDTSFKSYHIARDPKKYWTMPYIYIFWYKAWWYLAKVFFFPKFIHAFRFFSQRWIFPTGSQQPKGETKANYAWFLRWFLCMVSKMVSMLHDGCRLPSPNL